MAQPQVVLSDWQNRCLTFFWPEEENTFVGYRFWEETPETVDSRTNSYDRQPVSLKLSGPPEGKKSLQSDKTEMADRGWLVRYSETGESARGRMQFRAFEDGSARAEILEYDGHLNLELGFEPDDSGVRLWMKADTTRAIAGGYCLQQCLRFTGSMNQEWRTKIAHVPFLSELDMHAMGRPNATLTFGRREETWSQLPVQHTVVPTNPPAGNTEGTRLTFDHGLIVRESPRREEAPQWYWDRVAPETDWEQIVAGLYWERTARISNRHPADCVHAWVDIGPLDAGESRVVRGKVYYLEGSKDDLLARWQDDFANPG